jgi:hypothetical protein
MKRQRTVRPLQAGRAPIPKPKPTDELDWDVIQKELTEYFNSSEDATNAKAMTALADLVSAGCRERTVIQNLYMFCGGNPEQMQAVRMALDYKGRKKRMLAIAAQLHKASSEIGVAEQLLQDLGFTHNFKPDCSSIDRYANFLNRVGKIAYRNRASKRVSGRDQHLVFLSRYVESVTGAPHHGEIADLVDATRLHYDGNYTKTETAHSIRKRVDRHSPNLIVELELEATLELEGHPLSKARK